MKREVEDGENERGREREREKEGEGERGVRGRKMNRKRLEKKEKNRVAENR